jgi:hypothetical protein
VKRPALPATSVRGAIRKWIERHADKLGDHVLEIGSRRHAPDAWWLDNRDLARGEWTGIDMQPGPGVDVIADVHELPVAWRGYFSGLLCSEVLEHVARPWIALPKMRAVVKPGGWAIFTTLTCFPIHGFPDDFYRFTESGLGLMLEDAGFSSVELASAGRVTFELNDHGERGYSRRQSPMHVFAVAQC